MKKIQTSETLMLGILLAVSGGFMDAYSYLCRGGVFANAQTGNMLLLGVNLCSGDFSAALRYGIPIIAFSLGILLAEELRRLTRKKAEKGKNILHWRQFSVLIETIFFVAVCFIPQSLNLLANSLISLSCGIQLESFRTIRGNSIATTMCMGNLRSGTESLYAFFHSHDPALLNKSALYFGIILCFVFGAVIGDGIIGIFAEKALLFCAGILLLAFFLMFREEKENRK